MFRKEFSPHGSRCYFGPTISSFLSYLWESYSLLDLTASTFASFYLVRCVSQVHGTDGISVLSATTCNILRCSVFSVIHRKAFFVIVQCTVPVDAPESKRKSPLCLMVCTLYLFSCTFEPQTMKPEIAIQGIMHRDTCGYSINPLESSLGKIEEPHASMDVKFDSLRPI